MYRRRNLTLATPNCSGNSSEVRGASARLRHASRQNRTNHQHYRGWSSDFRADPAGSSIFAQTRGGIKNARLDRAGTRSKISEQRGFRGFSRRCLSANDRERRGIVDSLSQQAGNYSDDPHRKIFVRTGVLGNFPRATSDSTNPCAANGDFGAAQGAERPASATDAKQAPPTGDRRGNRMR